MHGRGVFLLTKWVAEAWKEINRNKETVIRSFKKCGLSLTLDGKENDEINIEGIPDYEMPQADEIDGAADVEFHQGKKWDLSNMLLTQTAAADYERLCRLDVLGLKDSPLGDQEIVHEEFKEQLTRSQDGWYETSLPWKANHPPLPNHKSGSLKRLDNLVRKLEKTRGPWSKYDQIIQDQLAQGIVEPAKDEAKGKEFYIPHKTSRTRIGRKLPRCA